MINVLEKLANLFGYVIMLAIIAIITYIGMGLFNGSAFTELFINTINSISAVLEYLFNTIMLPVYKGLYAFAEFGDTINNGTDTSLLLHATTFGIIGLSLILAFSFTVYVPLNLIIMPIAVLMSTDKRITAKVWSMMLDPFMIVNSVGIPVMSGLVTTFFMEKDEVALREMAINEDLATRLKNNKY